MIIWKFKPCVVSIYNDGGRSTYHTITKFNDESVSEAWPQWGDPDHIKASWYCGYGGDQWKMMMEHELAHAFIADWLQKLYSYSVWSHAHGTGDPGKEMSQRVADEEHLVTSFQRWLNTGMWDQYSRLDEIYNITVAGWEFQRIARPWLTGGKSP